ncbi:hypothetical protein CI102_4791 [Trichoderma harzianum]|uniref:Uncharacterized protein n=1 Tax=Trichoderma harzianum CBS 226.95 TaxID=983964 RepID=A0A2T4AIG4_TRIHA|nr:hypothetical protein M431DRAFT_388455 [Trichoderma harzianum CBS 226.95]PKK50617.1 hypothetical protein CI102_4791 [Trichoderma harzianum]PTB56884.1 hypothetical protein M431DRAFT_388455 [Trichoderma harzianum CBS 226.95]
MEVKVGGFAGCVCTCTRTLQVPRRCTRGRPMQAHVQSTRCMCSICTESLVHLTYMHVRNRDLISLPHDSCSSKSSGSRNRFFGGAVDVDAAFCFTATRLSGGRRSEIQRSRGLFLRSEFSLLQAIHIDVPVIVLYFVLVLKNASRNICAGRAWLRHPPSSHPPSPGYNKPWQPSHRTPVPGTHIAAVTFDPCADAFHRHEGEQASSRRHLPGGPPHNVAARPFCRL